MTNHTHSVKSLLFDIIFDDERRARELYDDIKRLHYKELEEAINHCMTKFVGSDTLVQLDQVVLDLGPIHYRKLNPDLVEKVKETLTQRLEELLKGVHKKEQLKDNTSASQLQLLRHFLLEGYLPWNSKENIADILKVLLKKERTALALLFREIGKSTTVQKRIITRFTTNSIEKIIHLLAPAHERLIRQFHRQLQQLIAHNSISNLPVSKLQKEIWLFILNYLLLHPPLNSQTTVLVRDTLVQLSQRFQFPFSKLLLLLTEEINYTQGTDNSGLKNVVTEVSKVLRPEELQKIQGGSQDDRLSSEEKTKILLRLLVHKSTTVNTRKLTANELQQHLMQLLESAESNRIIQLLYDPKKSTTVIQRMIQLFSIKPIHALIQRIESSHYKTIIDYQQNIIHIHQRAPFSSASEKGFSESLWEIIIEVLMNRSGSYFNQFTFLKGILAKVSSHYNIDYFELVERLQIVALQVSAKTSNMPVFLQLLREIHQDQKSSNAVKAVNPADDLLALEANSAKDNEAQTQIQNTFLKRQKNRKAIEQYFQRTDTMLSLSLVRKLLLEALVSEPSVIISTLKKQENYLQVIERLVQDFDEVVIEKIIQAIEPVHYQTVISYQKNTIAAQKQHKIIHTTETEMSDALWVIILKILLSHSSSKFNQKSFLKNLLAKTAVHYNIKYLDLINQLCHAIHLDKGYTGSQHTFMQLLYEIKLEEDALILKRQTITTSSKKKSIQKELSKVIPNTSSSEKVIAPELSRVSETLLEIILSEGALSSTLLAEQGFSSKAEAIQHLVLYQKSTLIQALKKAPAKVTLNFVAQLPEAASSILIQASQGSYTGQIQEFLQLLNRRLYDFGFSKRSNLMQDVRTQCLFALLQSPTYYPTKLSTTLEKTIQAYQLPNDFYTQKEVWRIPAKGNLESNIRDLEQRILRELEQDASSASKAAMLIQELLQAAKKQQRNIPYPPKEKKLMQKEIYITNAGLVIFNGYINFYFQQCGLLNDEGILDEESAERAALLLQYVIQPDGHFIEEDLVLNKLLCGLPLDHALPTDFEATEQEKNITAQMYAAIISHWDKVSNSTADGFRESWVIREGKLTNTEETWELLVEARSYDILLDYKPFSISPVKFNWMKKPINVNWR